jgi:protein SCO1/2
MRRQLTMSVIAAALAFGACRTSPPQYELRGQVLAVDRARQEITIKHEDIRGLMAGMTMPFKVKESRLLEGRVPGDLVRATLVVEESQGYLTSIEKTGHTDVVDAAPATHTYDILQPGEAVPDVVLKDETGRDRRLAEWKGQAVAVTFIYTRCPLPDFCPRMDRNFAAVQKSIQSTPSLNGHAHLISVSFDPRFDTTPVLREHASRQGADPSDWTFASGEGEAFRRFAERLGLSFAPDEKDAAQIVHNLRTAVIDPRGRLTTILSGNDWTPDDLLTAIRAALDNAQR